MSGPDTGGFMFASVRSVAKLCTNCGDVRRGPHIQPTFAAACAGFIARSFCLGMPQIGGERSEGFDEGAHRILTAGAFPGCDQKVTPSRLARSAAEPATALRVCSISQGRAVRSMHNLLGGVRRLRAALRDFVVEVLNDRFWDGCGRDSR